MLISDVIVVGEAIWSPRFYDYTVSVAPEGREATFMALSSAPIFAAKLPVGAVSGWLLATYCPAEGSRNSSVMWLIIWLLTLSSPILITITQRWIREPPSDQDRGALVVEGASGDVGGCDEDSEVKGLVGAVGSANVELEEMPVPVGHEMPEGSVEVDGERAVLVE